MWLYLPENGYYTNIDNGLVVEDKRVYAKLLKFFRTDYRKVLDVSYVRWRTGLDYLRMCDSGS